MSIPASQRHLFKLDWVLDPTMLAQQQRATGITSQYTAEIAAWCAELHQQLQDLAAEQDTLILLMGGNAAALRMDISHRPRHRRSQLAAPRAPTPRDRRWGSALSALAWCRGCPRRRRRSPRTRGSRPPRSATCPGDVASRDAPPRTGGAARRAHAQYRGYLARDPGAWGTVASPSARQCSWVSWRPCSDCNRMSATVCRRLIPAATDLPRAHSILDSQRRLAHRTPAASRCVAVGFRRPPKGFAARRLQNTERSCGLSGGVSLTSRSCR